MVLIGLVNAMGKNEGVECLWNYFKHGIIADAELQNLPPVFKEYFSLLLSN